MNSRDEDAPSLSYSSLAPAGVAPSPEVLLAPRHFPRDVFLAEVAGCVAGNTSFELQVWDGGPTPLL